MSKSRPGRSVATPSLLTRLSIYPVDPRRLIEADDFGNIVVKTGQEGRLVRLKDVVTERRSTEEGRAFGGIELGAKSQDTSCSLDGKPSVGLAIYQLPGSNALDTAERIRLRMEDLKASFPSGLDYQIVYDTTPFISESIAEVFKALRDAVILVAIVCWLFSSHGERR